MFIYAMSDIHGCLRAFEEALVKVDLSGDNKLLLLGDYIHGATYEGSLGVLEKIISLQEKYGSDKVIALAGNHEDMALDGTWPLGETDNERDDDQEERYLQWMKSLPRYYVTEHTIFVHAGIDEEAEDWWEWGTDNSTFTEKYPAQTGKFYMDIVAGHVGTSYIAGDSGFHDIYYDGESHYYIDGTVLESGVIPVLKVDTEQNKYYRVTESGAWLILPYEEEN